jgi:FAD/FMN-containing dehydrogenase
VVLSNLPLIKCEVLMLVFDDGKVQSRYETCYRATINCFSSAQQREPEPACIFRPQKALEVYTLVLLSRVTHCPFAVRSGGHAAFAGASSVDGGITVIFEDMKADHAIAGQVDRRKRARKPLI